MLISTKTHPPQVKANLLARTSLVNRLETGRESRLILISGPAGYGKTSLAVQWINQCDPNVAWYSVDESDNDPDLFFRYLVTALVNGGNGLKKDLNPMLQDKNLLCADEAIPKIIHTLSKISVTSQKIRVNEK